MSGSHARFLVILQPFLYDYRLQIFDQLSKSISCFILASIRCSIKSDIKYKNLETASPVEWASGLFSVLANCNSRKVIVFLPAYTSHLGIVLSAILMSLARVPVIVHGQALFKKARPGPVDLAISCFWLILSTKYISYSSVGIEGPFLLPVFRKKVLTIDNRFESLASLGLSDFDPKFDSYTGLGSRLRILFIGRNRPRSGFRLALELIDLLCRVGYDASLEVVGFHGEPSKCVTYYGHLSSPDIIPVASLCHIGLYPGDSGLSAIHYMALGLCPIVHSELRLHCGPEPVHVVDGLTGCLFERGSLSDLFRVFKGLVASPRKLRFIRERAYRRATEIHATPFSSELMSVLNLIS